MLYNFSLLSVTWHLFNIPLTKTGHMAKLKNNKMENIYCLFWEVLESYLAKTSVPIIPIISSEELGTIMQLIPGPLGYKRRIKKVGKWGLDLIKQGAKTRLEISIGPQNNDTDDDVFV